MRLILASRSPRRLELLREHGFEPEVLIAEVDDSDLIPGQTSPGEWTSALAYLKARAITDTVLGPERERSVVIAADTMCVKGTELIGKPENREDAERIIRALMNGSHEVLTGVSIVSPSRSELFVDRAIVRVGSITPSQIDTYLNSELWHGKAGGYNLNERINGGWPITFEGDPTCVTGLPMRRVVPILRSMLTRRDDPECATMTQ
ncbi:MAG: Maf family protein [Planctomycetota bacterium]